MKNWVSKRSGVVSNGVLRANSEFFAFVRKSAHPGMDSSTWSAAAIVWLSWAEGWIIRRLIKSHDASKATVSAALNPPLAIFCRITVTLSVKIREGSESETRHVPNGSGMRKLGEAAFGWGLPITKESLGAPGQLETPTAPANWILFCTVISNQNRQIKNLTNLQGWE